MKTTNDNSHAGISFAGFLTAVDALLTARHGITHEDTNLDLIKACHQAGETPEECVDEIATKYDLERTDGVYLLLVRGGGR